MIIDHQAVLIERDNGGDAPNVARFKRLFVLDFDDAGPGSYDTKTMLADLMAIPDPDGLAGPLSASGYFNFPFSNGRSFTKAVHWSPMTTSSFASASISARSWTVPC